MDDRTNDTAELVALAASLDRLGDALVRELKAMEGTMRRLQLLSEDASELITPELIIGAAPPHGR